MPLRICHPVSWLPLNSSHSALAFQGLSAAPLAARRIFLSLSRFPSLYRRGFRLYFTKQNASANSKLINNDTFRNSHVILSFIPIPPRVSHFAICRTIAAASGSSLIISIYVKPFYSSISLKSSAILSKCVDTPKSASRKESTVSVSVFLLSNWFDSPDTILEIPVISADKSHKFIFSSLMSFPFRRAVIIYL